MEIPTKSSSILSSLVTLPDLTSEAKDHVWVVNLVAFKVICLVTMAVFTTFLCTIPIVFLQRANNTRDASTRRRLGQLVSYASCFSGGVFVAACMLDLLPEVEEAVQDLLEDLEKQDVTFLSLYPVAHFIIACGFLLILSIEQVVFSVQEKWSHEEESVSLLRSNNGNVRSYQTPHIHREHFNHHHHERDSRHEQDSNHDHIAVYPKSTMRAVMLLLALSFHSIFEGMAIGLQDTSTNCVSLMIAVMLHKAVMAFSVGLNIAQSELSSSSTRLSVMFFSLSSPLGIGLGILWVGMPSSLAQKIVSAVLQGVAGGTFIYVTFFEVLPHELNMADNRLKKCLFVLFGYTLTCVLLMALPA